MKKTIIYIVIVYQCTAIFAGYIAIFIAVNAQGYTVVAFGIAAPYSFAATVTSYCLGIVAIRAHNKFVKFNGVCLF